jgi:hypothetical protein
MKKHKLLYLLIIFPFLNSFAQLPEIGQWRDHLNYTNGISVAAGGGKSYMATRNGLFSYDRQEGEIDRFSKISGLSDIGFNKIAYNKKAKALLIVYQNSNIDILKNDRIFNMGDIRRSNIIGDKYIYGITLEGPLAYLATGFGVVVLDVHKREVKDTYQFGENGKAIKTNKVVVTKDSIYAATDNGIYQASLKAPNLADFKFWAKKTNLPNPDMGVRDMVLLKDKIFLLNISHTFQDDSVYYFTPNGPLTFFNREENTKVYFMDVAEDLIYFCQYYFTIGYDETAKRKFYLGSYYDDTFPLPRAVAIDEREHRWIADEQQGLIFSHDGSIAEKTAPFGPKATNVNKITAVKDNIWIAAGGKDVDWKSINNYEPISMLKENSWKSVYPTSQTIGNIHDILQVAINPSNPTTNYFAASWGGGLVEFNDEKIVKIHNWSNSPLEADNVPVNDKRTTVASAVYDKEGNLWLVNTLAKKPLKVVKPDGSWLNFELMGVPTSTVLGDILITRNNHKWILQPKGKSLAVYDHNNTLDDPGDDRVAILSEGEGRGNIPGTVSSIAEDHDGRIWLGTSNGVVVFYNPAGVFGDNNFDAQPIKLVQDGNVQLLLENQAVTAIAVDGANRKWFGTDGGGVFLMSADGTQQLQAFNTSNSPLFSDVITSIAITNNGEVFFGTEKGLVSYRGTATTGGFAHGNVYAFPNPVRAGFEGLIAVSGLVADADVKITDINGNLVHQTKANGGQAVWNGITLRGDRAKTGVYLVFSSDRDGNETMVTKIMFLN